MASSLTTLISNIRSTASGPTMREKIAQAFEGARDGYTTAQKTGSALSTTAGAVTSGSLSASLSGYTPIGIIGSKLSKTTVCVSYAYIDGSTIFYGIYNPTGAAVSVAPTFTVLYRNNTNA